MSRDHGPRRRTGVPIGGAPRSAGGRPAAGVPPVAAVLLLLGVLLGTSAEVLAQEGEGGGRDRLGEVERKVGEAEDVIVEQVLALRGRMEALETRVHLLEAELAKLRDAPAPPR